MATRAEQEAAAAAKRRADYRMKDEARLEGKRQAEEKAKEAAKAAKKAKEQRARKDKVRAASKDRYAHAKSPSAAQKKPTQTPVSKPAATPTATPKPVTTEKTKPLGYRNAEQMKEIRKAETQRWLKFNQSLRKKPSGSNVPAPRPTASTSARVDYKAPTWKSAQKPKTPPGGKGSLPADIQGKMKTIRGWLPKSSKGKKF